MVKYVPTYTKDMLRKKEKKKLDTDSSNDAYAMFLYCFFPDFLYKSICFGYSFYWH